MRFVAGILAVVLASACGTQTRIATTPSPSPSPTGPGRPIAFVGVDGRGDIVVARTADGRVERRLVEQPGNPEQPGNGVASLSLADGGETLFYSVTTTPYCGSTWSAPVAGGAATRISDGASSSIAPDGSRLAWVKPAFCEGGGALVIRDNATGAERSWTFNDEFEGPAAVVDWAADSKTLFLLGCGVDACGVMVFDPATATTAMDGRWLETMIDGRDFSWGSVLRRNDHLVVGVDYGDVGGDERYPLLEIDPADGRIVTQLMADWRSTVPLDYDRTGEWLLTLKDDRLGYVAGRTFAPIADGFANGIWIG